MSHTLAWEPQHRIALHVGFSGVKVGDHAPEQFAYRREVGVQHDADMCPPLPLPARIERKHDRKGGKSRPNVSNVSNDDKNPPAPPVNSPTSEGNEWEETI